jgi:deoxyribodipyrimidine photo-lyase
MSNPETEGDLRREFASREELIAYLREQFPGAATVDDHVTQVRGGRRAAETALRRSQVGARYRQTRNYLDGAVTRLSAYLRHGVLSLAEVRDAVLHKARSGGGNVKHAEKFINELGWRDYFQHVYTALGDGVWKDQEPYKTGLAAEEYAGELPGDVRHGQTGLVCIDAFSRELAETGYLHNHARLWMAAYVVHWRRVKWQAGARWFLEHLLDGDPASNNLSWQWVASTFSQKPYYFNRANLERFSGGHYCRRCPLYGRCDFEGSYESLGRKLFPNDGQSLL